MIWLADTFLKVAPAPNESRYGFLVHADAAFFGSAQRSKRQRSGVEQLTWSALFWRAFYWNKTDNQYTNTNYDHQCGNKMTLKMGLSTMPPLHQQSTVIWNLGASQFDNIISIFQKKKESVKEVNVVLLSRGSCRYLYRYDVTSTIQWNEMWPKVEIVDRKQWVVINFWKENGGKRWQHQKNHLLGSAKWIVWIDVGSGIGCKVVSKVGSTVG